MDLNSEMYFCLGEYDGTYYFNHLLFKKEQWSKLTHNPDYSILNCLINEKIVKDTKKRVVVFTVTPTCTKVTCISHAQGEVMRYDHKRLEDDYCKYIIQFMMRPKNENLIIIKYSYATGAFYIYNVPVDTSLLRHSFVNLNQISIAKDNIEYVQTKKDLSEIDGNIS